MSTQRVRSLPRINKSTNAKSVNKLNNKVVNKKNVAETPAVEKNNVTNVNNVTSMPIVDQPDAMAELNNNAKSVVVKGKVVAKSPKKTRVTVKKQATRSPKKTPTRSPRKTATKTTRTVKTTKTATRTNKKAASKSPKRQTGKRTTSKKTANKKQVTKRTHNTKPTALDIAGVCIGPARVRSVLMHTSLNPREHQVRLAIMAAENRPIRAKPTEENPNPPEPVQGPQTNIEDLPTDVLSVIREAEALHERTIREGYEREVMSNMSKDTKAQYLDARRLAQQKENFNLTAFNQSFDANFYDGLEQYVADNDSYVVGEKYNQWTRASALVNKLTIRLSGNTRYIVAAFLDRIVEQYAYNGIHNCLLEGRHIIKPRHALTQTEGFDTRVPLDCFVKTFRNYGIGLNWIEACKEVREEVTKFKNEGKEVEFELPDYPDMGYDAKFDEYVGEICRSVRMRLASQEDDEEKRNSYLNTSVSKTFKRFCSDIVFEAILRIGTILRCSLQRANVKTVSDSMVRYAIEQIHNVCGMDFETVSNVISERLERFSEYRQKRKEDRRRKKNNASTEQSVDDEPEVDEDDEVDEEEEEVEEEAEDDNDEVEDDEDEDDDVEIEYQDE